MSNTKNSPFKRGESVAGIADWLNYGSIAQAGQPASLTGEAVIQLGALFSQMDFGFGKGKTEPTADEDEKEKPDLEKVFKVNPEKLKPKLPPPADLSKIIRPILPPRPTTTVFADPKITDQGVNLGFTSSQQEQDGVVRDTTGRGTSSTASMATDIDNIKWKEQFPLQTRDIDLGNISSIINPKKPPVNRLSDETLNALNGLRYTNKDKEDTPLRRVMHAVTSPFLQTDNLSYGQIKRAVMPEYAKGRLGAAAAEGFNLVIDKYNYDQAVKRDYDQELEDQMGDLVVPADFISDTARQEYLNLSLQKKKRLAEGFNDYANGRISKLDYENLKSTLKSEIDQAAAARTNITAAVTDFIKNKGAIDIGASKSQMLDFLLTAEKSPEKISIKSIDGVDYVTGTTRGGQYFQVPTSKIANGTAGFRLVEKASAAPIVNGALKAIDQYKEEVKTRYGLGQADADPETAKKIGVNYIKNQLKDETKLRSIMSQIFGVDHTAFQQFIENDETLSAEMLNDAAEELYDMSVAPQYFPQQKTTRVIQPRGGSSTAGERTQQQLASYYNKLGTPTAANILQYQSNIENFPNKYQVVESEDGQFGIVKSDKPDEFISMLDLNNPEQVKKIMFSFGGLKPYSLPTKK